MVGGDRERGKRKEKSKLRSVSSTRKGRLELQTLKEKKELSQDGKARVTAAGAAHGVMDDARSTRFLGGGRNLPGRRDGVAGSPGRFGTLLLPLRLRVQL